MAYCTIDELREECISESDADDDRLLTLMDVASRQFERWTGRFFEPRSATFRLSGRGSRVLYLDQPIISIASLMIDDDPVDADSFVVYNRHLSGLLAPDDRNLPRIELVQSRPIGLRRAMDRSAFVFPVGQQNVTVSGVFGYTDPGGTDQGRTPPPVKRAVMLLVVRMLAGVGDTDARTDALASGRIIEERTRDQAYKLDRNAADPSMTGRFSGDGEIDQIVGLYRRTTAVMGV